MRADFPDLLVDILIKEVFDGAATRKEVLLRMRDGSGLITAALSLPDVQNVGQGSIFIRPLQCMFPQQSSDIYMCMECHLEDQELR